MAWKESGKTQLILLHRMKKNSLFTGIQQKLLSKLPNIFDGNFLYGIGWEEFLLSIGRGKGSTSGTSVLIVSLVWVSGSLGKGKGSTSGTSVLIVSLVWLSGSLGKSESFPVSLSEGLFLSSGLASLEG